MPIIERNKENEDYVKQLYEMNIVNFEVTILKSKQYDYSISYCPKQKIYDVVIEDNINCKLVNYEARQQLSNSTLKYFNLYKNDKIQDKFSNEFICITHYIEFEL